MTSGRLSEMFGSGQVKTDSFLRTLGWHRVAQQEYDTKLSPETKKNLQAYSAGVNAYLKGKDGKQISVEYAALNLTNDYKPDAWTPVDSVAWLKAMAWDLRGNMQDEIDRSLMTSRLSTQQISDLYPSYPYNRNKPIVQQGGIDPVTGKFDQNAKPGGAVGGSDTATGAVQGMQSQLSSLSDTLDKIPTLLGPSGSGIGSNSWVVSGDLTTTGKPLLANDPHLAPQLPSLWYQMGLHCRTISSSCHYDAIGYTFSGMPGVVIGHNQNISWGFTNLGADVTDLYLEKVTDNGYLYNGEEKPFRTREETIKVAAWQVAADRRTRDEQRPAGLRPGHRTGEGRPDGARDLGRPGPRQRLRGGPQVDRAPAGQFDGRGLRPGQGQGLDRLPGRRQELRRPLTEPDLRRHQGQHRLPGARLHPDPLQGRRRHDARSGLGPQVRLEGHDPLRPAALRVQPEARLHRHRQPGRDRPEEVPVPDHR